MNIFKEVAILNDYPNLLKNTMQSIIHDMSENTESFVVDAEKNFTRDRKLNFDNMINIILSMGGKSIYSELLEYTGYSIDTPTPSGFVQQRSKLLPHAFEYLFNKFTDTYKELKTFNGYRMLAVDGSALVCVANPDEPSSYTKLNQFEKRYNELHINALFDLNNRLYLDCIVQARHEQNEYGAFIRMAERSEIEGKAIVIADRGYESYNVLEHLNRKGWKYIIRGKDINSITGIAHGNAEAFANLNEFDVDVNKVLTRRITNEIKAHPEKYKWLPQNVKFDFMDKSDPYCPISFRIVRFEISDGQYETIITNLDRDEFSSKLIKKIYSLRWGIETSFRELKYALGLTSLHTKKAVYITQEIFARLTMYNFCEMVTLHVVIKQHKTKYNYQVNFTVAIHVCIRFFRCRSNIAPPDVEALIQKNVLPIRDGRSHTRNVRDGHPVSFTYRLS